MIETIRNETLRETVFLERHASGLPIFVCRKPGFAKAYACFSVFYGSVDDEFIVPGESEPTRVPEGIAHFLEHKLFEGRGGNALEIFARNGASGNAYTSFRQTTYLFSCAEGFAENFRLLVDFVREPYFTDENVEKEKGIIEQEIRMYEDYPPVVLYMSLLECLFARHPIRIHVAGTVGSIRRIDRTLLERCYRTFYRPSNMLLFAVGDFDPDDVFRMADEALAGQPADDAPPIRRIYPEEGPDVAVRESRQRMVVALPKIAIGFKDGGAGGGGRLLLERELATEFALDIVFGKGGDLYRDLYDAGLIDESFSWHTVVHPELGYSMVGGDTPRPAELERRVLDAVRRAADEVAAPARFERARRKFLGAFLKRFNAIEFIANNFAFYRFLGANLFDAADIIAAMDRDAIQERIREHLSAEKAALAIIEPGEPGADPQTGSS